MSGSPAVFMRLLASAHTVAEKAGAIVRKVLHSGELGIVEKVGPSLLKVFERHNKMPITCPRWTH